MDKIKTGIKIKVNPEQSRKIQEICFENGIDWLERDSTVKFLNKPFLFIDNLISFMHKEEEDDFLEEDNEEVSAELFIRTKGTCVEPETLAEDNKDEQKLECLVEGYEGTYFELGQVWETREGNKLKIICFDLKTDMYKVTLFELEDKDKNNLYYTQKGEFYEEEMSDMNLVKLITDNNEIEVVTETTPSDPQPKTLSEYLRDNNAYESFVENSVEAFLKDLGWYKDFKSENKRISLGNIFIFEDTKEGYIYWLNLKSNIQKPIIFNMNEIIFAEVDKRIAEQKTTTVFISTEEFDQMLQQKEQPNQKFLVYVHGKNAPKHIHDSYDSAEKEAKRLAEKEIGCNISIVSVVKTFKSKIIIEEVE